MEGQPTAVSPATTTPAPMSGMGDGGSARGGGGRPRIWKRRWFQGLLSVLSVVTVVGVCAEMGRRANTYGKHVVESKPVDARIEISNPPAYLDRAIVNSLLEESYNFAQKDEATYNRARNVLDGAILREFADLYTGTETVDGKTQPRQQVGYNAWIERITEVRREVAKDKSQQTIQIMVQWRQPEAWVRVGDKLCLIDAQGTRLPGDYRPEDRPRSRLLVITGVDAPSGGLPQPGEKWVSGKNGAMGDDMLAAMELVDRLKRQPFALQIDAVDMTNFGGKKDAKGPWITLQTIWQAADGSARMVMWGRPVGDEKYYEVQADVKLKTLNEIYQRFSRIDAGRDYVDIRTEVVRLPKLAAVPESPSR